MIILLPSFINKLKRLIFSSPNRIIIGAGIVIATSLSWVAYLMRVNQEIWSDFLMNLSAGVVTVVLTVILVDMLRVNHKKKQYAIPQNAAMQRLVASHSGFVLGLIAQVYKGSTQLQDFAKDFMASGEEANKGNMSVLSTLLTRYAKKMSTLKADEILKNYSQAELTTSLKADAERLKNEIEKISRRYDFSFIDLDFNTELAQLINSIDGLIDIFIVYKIDDVTLNKMLASQDSSTTATKTLIGSMLISYLKLYTAFVDKYGLNKQI